MIAMKGRAIKPSQSGWVSIWMRLIRVTPCVTSGTTTNALAR